MFDKIQSTEELYATENENEYYQRKLMEYHEQTKIKQAITAFSKMRLFNIDQQQKRKYQCYHKCYENNSTIFENHQEGLQKLDTCLTDCKKETRDLKQFLKNVDKLVYFKNQTCHSNCEKLVNDNIDQTVQECRWICENKLDRRYRDFWLKQRNDIIERHSHKQYD